MASLSFGTAAYMEPLFALVLAFAAGLLYKRYSAKSRIVAPAVKATPQFTKDGYPIIEPKGRQAGHWPPDLEFRYPPVEPADFDIETKLPPLYRPFRGLSSSGKIYLKRVIRLGQTVPGDGSSSDGLERMVSL
jgi:hypothetical protein